VLSVHGRARKRAYMDMATEETDPGPSPAKCPTQVRLLDATILVAATAIGFALQEFLSRSTQGDLSWRSLFARSARLLHSPDGESRVERTAMLFGGLICLLNPIVASWTLALQPIRWLLPRSRSRRVGYQPGVLAARTASIVGAVFALLSGCIIAVSGGDGFSHGLAGAIIVIVLPVFVAPAVIFTWMTLAARGRWRAERSWIDRFGRAVGIYWIVAALLTIVAMATR
jgi:hypothetical protein